MTACSSMGDLSVPSRSFLTLRPSVRQVISDGCAVTKSQPALLLQTAQPMRVERPESGKPKYCMNFQGRVALQSTKNFILTTTPDDNSPILLVTPLPRLLENESID